MALGGGTWQVQNKVLPGYYVNFSSVPRASATLSDRGFAAAPFELSWGPEGEVFAVTSGEFQKNSKTIFGYAYDHPKMLPLREIFTHATTVYCNNHSYNKNATRTAMIKAAANQSPPVFGFDCVCLIKGILWGWDGDASRTYGGAGYAINGVPDIGADTMITKCTGVSTTGWDDMVIGEAVWMSGHIGIYIGDGLAVECSPKWENKVQITAVGNIGSKAGYNTRRWTKHGKLPYVDYTGASTGGGSQGTTQPSKPSEGTVGACVGDTVTFTGNKHYVSSNALNGSACKPGKAKVTAMAGNAKHPYHLIKVPGGGSTVYGWVDAADIQVEGGITVGSKVKVNKGAKTYTGGGLASFVYTNTYTVIQVDGDRVVIGQNGVVTAAVNSKDLTLVG